MPSPAKSPQPARTQPTSALRSLSSLRPVQPLHPSRRLRPIRPSNRHASAAFTLLELLVATAVLLVLMVVLFQVVGAIADVWKKGAGKVSALQNARSAFSTVTRTLARATLNTYNDYVQETPAGSKNFVYRNSTNASTFQPTNFKRASELHFITGPTSTFIPGASADGNPGSVVLFQAPLGDTLDAAYAPLDRALNSVGFYVHYGQTNDSIVPQWLQTLFPSRYRFQLIQIVEPTENFQVYKSTAAVKPAAPKDYDRDWVVPFTAPTIPPDAAKPRARVLAEDVCLLVLRPRLSPKDEATAAPLIGGTYDPAKDLGSILSPKYAYDSRAWEPDYTGEVTPKTRIELMRNQIPPIIDVAMVSLDSKSLARINFSTATPPPELKVPATFFKDSVKFEEDLAAYSQQLWDAGIRHRVLRTAVDIQGAKWSSTN